MAKNIKPDVIEVTSRPFTAGDERLVKLFDELENQSMETLESAARQIVTLSTTLLAAFFGLLSLKDAPAFLGFLEVKIIAAAALLGFILALAFALTAILPRHYEFSYADLSAKRAALKTMLSIKRNGVWISGIIFGVSVLAMLLAALDILFFHI